MPWKKSVIVDERMKFVGRLLEGDKVTEFCREFGILRKTGCKFWDRYKEVGLHGLTDRAMRECVKSTVCRGLFGQITVRRLQ